MMKTRLFTPGPVSSYPPALSAALESNIHHRTAEFKEILVDVYAALGRVLGNPAHVFLFAASGSGAMEAAVTNFFSPGDEVLVASCGKFGERWVELTQRFGLQTHVLKSSYGEPVRPEEVRDLLNTKPFKGVFIQACESSTGIQNDVEAIGGVVKNSDALLIVDAVSALATMPLSPSFGIDVLLSGSQKALMIPPGLSFLGANERAWARVESAKLPRYYFDLRMAKKSWDQGNQTPFTPATSLILSLQKSLQAIERMGLDRLIRLTENRAKATRAALHALSLELFASPAPANALTAVKHHEADRITSGLKKRFGIHLAGGQGDMKGKIFRISHMGFMDHFDLLAVLSGLEFVLQEVGHSVDAGSSLKAFQETYAEVA